MFESDVTTILFDFRSNVNVRYYITLKCNTFQCYIMFRSSTNIISITKSFSASTDLLIGSGALRILEGNGRCRHLSIYKPAQGKQDSISRTVV